MLKKGDIGVYKGYKKRYFVLRKDKLYYYKNYEDYCTTQQKYINFIAIQQIMSVELTPQDFDTTSQKHYR